MGAVVALPFTLIRLTHSRRQTQTAKEALFNNKIDAAVSDLHAQRQVTRWTGDDANNGWEDDVTRRNGAIDRLEGLAGEDPNTAPRIARMLSVYVRELSREMPAIVPPETEDVRKLHIWALDLKPARSDMQNAVQVLGRLKAVSGLQLDDGEIDLTNANLQGHDLTDLDLGMAKLKNVNLQAADLTEAKLKGTDLTNANLQCADLCGANLQETNLCFAKLQGANVFGAKLQGTLFIRAQLQGADLRLAELEKSTAFNGAIFSGAAVSETDFTNSNITQSQLGQLFGDATVTLPEGHGPEHKDWPKHWSKDVLDYIDFSTQWRAFQAKIGYDPDAPQ
jgi:hypothetical protein